MVVVATACVSTMIKAPSHSDELFTSVDFQTDSLLQLFICHVGYELQTSSTSHSVVMLDRKCVKGVWTPSEPVDCVRSELIVSIVHAL